MYAPKASGNLLSVKGLTGQNLTVNFEKNEYQIKSKADIVAVGTLKGELYELQEERIFTAKAQADILCVHEWHERLAHRNLNDIKKMQKNGLIIKAYNCSDM